jgi:hypothetical protein
MNLLARSYTENPKSHRGENRHHCQKTLPQEQSMSQMTTGLTKQSVCYFQFFHLFYDHIINPDELINLGCRYVQKCQA